MYTRFSIHIWHKEEGEEGIEYSISKSSIHTTAKLKERARLDLTDQDITIPSGFTR